MPYRFILEPYKGIKTRYICPNCQNKNKTFSRYIDTETGEYLSNIVGRCNRENNCKHHYTPKQYFQNNNNSLYNIKKQSNFKANFKSSVKKQISYINADVLKESLKTFEENNFIKFLFDLFGNDITSDLISKYFIGNSNYWKGSTVFWQIDITGKIRTGKIMLYNSIRGKRIKEPYNHIHWYHKLINDPLYSLQQCLFGEHLLQDRTKSVAVVESEKTAIIASVYFPKYIWLASGGINNINQANCNVLENRNVVFYPDFGAFEKWDKVVKKLQNNSNFRISDFLETEGVKYNLPKNSDITDILLTKIAPCLENPQDLYPKNHLSVTPC